MKSYIAFAGMLLLSGLFTGCAKEAADTTPSGIIDTYTLPQGNHAFDAQIMSYYQKYGSYLLYKFSDRDAYWTPTAYTKPVASSSGAWSAGVDVDMADTNYIAAQISLIQEKWFSYYSDAFLKKFLPSKILLCSKIDSIYNGYVFTPVFAYIKNAKPIAANYSYDNITVNFGRDTINSFTELNKRDFLTKVNVEFIKSIGSRTLSVPPTTFTGLANYAATYTSQAAAYAQGILLPYYNGLSAQADWNAYMLAMVTYSEDELNASVANYDMTARGMLNVTKDTNGKIKTRYNMVRNYFINQYQVDLQKIGNAARGK